MQGVFLLLAMYALSQPPLCLEYTPGYRILSRLILRFDLGAHRFWSSFFSSGLQL